MVFNLNILDLGVAAAAWLILIPLLLNFLFIYLFYLFIHLKLGSVWRWGGWRESRDDEGRSWWGFLTPCLVFYLLLWACYLFSVVLFFVYSFYLFLSSFLFVSMLHVFLIMFDVVTSRVLLILLVWRYFCALICLFSSYFMRSVNRQLYEWTLPIFLLREDGKMIEEVGQGREIVGKVKDVGAWNVCEWVVHLASSIDYKSKKKNSNQLMSRITETMTCLTIVLKLEYINN